ncbi:uncharacterized protein BDR25DRAFT_301506 [Lindgomyces ingoldianus]|uniref:Uncharacterized protein n=1 Tax=Lindgomyces ingoldianus TaxID=673940 RepID=A0ACB6R8Z7_9PLEO|nr:uncharacterized protein BDR25DRAFT_301506 [Lindgomyces ingoldianus]KAF2474936.1 hypothetical protein BDR25DRAFT_301506 [Lindgomyces ingoldianus]
MSTILFNTHPHHQYPHQHRIAPISFSSKIDSFPPSAPPPIATFSVAPNPSLRGN